MVFVTCIVLFPSNWYLPYIIIYYIQSKKNIKNEYNTVDIEINECESMVTGNNVKLINMITEFINANFYYCKPDTFTFFAFIKTLQYILNLLYTC